MNKESKYAKDSIVGIIGKASQLIGGYGSLWLLTNILSDVRYGGYVAALAVITLVALLAQAGLKQATIQRVGELAVDQRQAIPEYAGSAIAWVGIASLGVTVTTWLLTPLMSAFIDTNVLRWLRLLTLLIPGMSLLPICSGVLRGLERVSTAVILQQITVQVIRLLGLILAWLYWQDAVAVVLALGLAYYIPVAAFAIWTRGWQYLNLTGMSLSHIRYSGYLLVNSIASRFLKNTDILLLASLATLPATGGYNVAWKLAIVARYGDQILTKTLQPRLSKYLAADKIEALHKEFDQVRDLSVVATIPVLIVVLLFGRPLLAVFGTYADQYTVLIILTVGAMTNAAFGKVGNILIMGKRGRLVLINTLINIGGNVVLNIILIPQYDTMGAALATVFTVYFLTNLVALVQVYYYMDINTSDVITMAMTGIAAIFTGLGAVGIIKVEVAILLLIAVAGSLLYRRVAFLRGMFLPVWDTIRGYINNSDNEGNK